MWITWAGKEATGEAESESATADRSEATAIREEVDGEVIDEDRKRKRAMTVSWDEDSV